MSLLGIEPQELHDLEKFKLQFFSNHTNCETSTEKGTHLNMKEIISRLISELSLNDLA